MTCLTHVAVTRSLYYSLLWCSLGQCFNNFMPYKNKIFKGSEVLMFKVSAFAEFSIERCGKASA